VTRDAVRRFRSRAALALHGGVVRTLGGLSLDRQRRADLLRVRLGIDAGRGWLLRCVPRALAHGSVLRPRPAPAVDAGPRRGLRGLDQAAPRPLLARADLPLLPLRNAAAPQSAQLVFPSPAEAAPPLRRALQPPGATGGSVRLVRAAADCLAGRRTDYLPPD